MVNLAASSSAVDFSARLNAVKKARTIKSTGSCIVERVVANAVWNENIYCKTSTCG